MKFKYLLVLLFALSLFSIQCKEPTEPEENNSQIINGKVIDKNGNPIEGVGVHYNYTVTSSVKKLQKENTLFNFPFYLEKKSFVTLSLYRYYTNDLLHTFINDTLESGNHSYQADVSDLTNGFYNYVLKIDTTEYKNTFSLNVTDISKLIETKQLVKTNSNGEFSLPYELLGFNISFEQKDEQGNVISTSKVSPNIEIVLHKSGYQALVQPVSIDLNKEANLTFTFQ